MDRPTGLESPDDWELRFISVSCIGRGFAFPCDASGNVPLDDLSEAMRRNYFYARACVGREFYAPSVARRWAVALANR